MDDALDVRVAERAREIGEQRDGLRDARPFDATVALEHLPQTLALHVLHHEVEEIVGFTGGVDRDDVRVAQARHRACLTQEPLPRGRRRREIGRDDLDRHRPVERDVASEQHLAHAAGAELALDVVSAGERLPKTDEQWRDG